MPLPVQTYQNRAVSHFHSREPLDIPASQLYSKPFSHAFAVVEEQQWCRTQR